MEKEEEDNRGEFIIMNEMKREKEESQIAQKITYLRESRLFETCN